MANHVLYDRLWESDRLADCSRDAALAYPWIFLVADDHGRFEYKPRAIWKHAFSYRKDVTVEDVSGWLAEYWRVGLLTRYHADGGLAYWYKFRGRKPSDRRPSEFPNPDGTQVLTYDPATPPPRRGDDPATPPRQTRARDRSDQIRDRSETTDPVAIAPDPSAPPFDADDTTAPGEVPPAESVALAKAHVLSEPLPWNREAAELWWQEYKGDPPKQFFGQLKPLVKREGWERVRPALVTYMAETPCEYVNIAGKFVAAFGTWEARARGRPPVRASPVSAKAQARQDSANAFLRGGLNGDRRNVAVGDESAGGIAARSGDDGRDADGSSAVLPRGAKPPD